MNDFESAVAAVYSAYAAGIKAGTATTRKLLDRLGSPDEKLKIIHVAGTNGKGSVTEYLTQILIAAGKRVGTFRSPAVYDYCEQFLTDGKPIPRYALKNYLSAAIDVAQGTGATGFEIETACAINAFYKEGCEYAVIECGMGGRDDATNAIARKELAVITSVSLEHTNYLGKTIKEICDHKAGIIKNCPAVASGLQSAESRAYLGGYGVIFADEGLEIISESFDGVRFLYDGKEYKTTMLGAFQAYNAATAIRAAKLLKIDENAIYSGVYAACLAGRAEVLRTFDATYVLDGAHNPAAVRAFANTVQNLFKNERKHVIFGCLSDKDMDGNLKILSEISDEISIVKCPSARAADLSQTELCGKKYFEKVKTYNSVKDALRAANGKLILVCGSFTILNEAKLWIEKKL